MGNKPGKQDNIKIERKKKRFDGCGCVSEPYHSSPENSSDRPLLRNCHNSVDQSDNRSNNQPSDTSNVRSNDRSNVRSDNRSNVNPDNKSNRKDRDVDVVIISGDIQTSEGTKKLKLVIDEDELVRVLCNPMLETKAPDMAYLVGYKMVYLVDGYRQKIPNVMAIITLKIPRDHNAIYQSEGSHKSKEMYEMLDLTKKIDHDKHYDRETQASSLSYSGGDMIAWEHSTKYCAYKVEPLSITICGKFKNVLKASRDYNRNIAFAESAYTYEENKDPAIYEIGIENISKHEKPNVSSGRCLDFFHFFLRPEYAIDYGFWQFQYAEQKSDVDRSTLVLSKGFGSIRKISYIDAVNANNASDLDLDSDPDVVEGIRSARLIKTGGGWISNQILAKHELEKKNKQNNNNAIEMQLLEEEKLLKQQVSVAKSRQAIQADTLAEPEPCITLPNQPEEPGYIEMNDIEPGASFPDNIQPEGIGSKGFELKQLQPEGFEPENIEQNDQPYESVYPKIEPSDNAAINPLDQRDQWDQQNQHSLEGFTTAPPGGPAIDSEPIDDCKSNAEKMCDDNRTSYPVIDNGTEHRIDLQVNNAWSSDNVSESNDAGLKRRGIVKYV